MRTSTEPGSAGECPDREREKGKRSSLATDAFPAKNSAVDFILLSLCLSFGLLWLPAVCCRYYLQLNTRCTESATRTKQVKISITKNAHVLSGQQDGKSKRNRMIERERETVWLTVSSCYKKTKHKKLLERVLQCDFVHVLFVLVLRSLLCLHAASAPAQFVSSFSFCLVLFCVFWGARATHARKLSPKCRLSIRWSFLRSLWLISVSHKPLTALSKILGLIREGY